MTSRTLLPGTGNATKARAKGQAGPANLDRLVERVAAGDSAAFEKLYRRTVGSVHALVCRVLTEDAPSAEVTTEVYLRVWSNARAYERTLHTAENWLLDLAHRCAVERLRADRSTPAREPILPAPPGGAGRATELLTPEQAEALELAYLGGATHAESAQALGVDQATFRIRVGTALSRLRQDQDTGRRATPPWSDHTTRKQT